MTTQQMEFDTKVMNALNNNIQKCLDGIKAASLLSDALNPEERRLLARATEDYKNGHFNAAAIRYKSYVTSKRKMPVNNNEHSRLDIIVQYLVCRCLLHSNQFQELSEARSMLTDLEASVGSIYPMIYYGLAQFYIKVFCFDEAQRMATNGLIISNTGNYPVCYLPESQDIILESTEEELTKLLSDLIEQCSGWHPPDARCFMTICKCTSQNHLCDRDIFIKSPAYNGMVTIVCSNTTNPCEINFHCACWKVKKDEATLAAKISDKEVLLNWECFTPNCGTEEAPSLIKKITIHKEDGSVIDVDPPADKFHWQPQPPAPSSKGAIRKQKHVNKPSAAKVVKPKPPSDTHNEANDHIHATITNNNPHNDDHFNLAQDVDVNEPTKSSTLCDPFEVMKMKIMDMISLRESNFNIKSDNDWRPNKVCYGNEHVLLTIHTGYEPDFSGDGDTVAHIKSFLFSYFLSFIEHRGPIKNDELLKEWTSLTDCRDFAPISKNWSGIIEIRKFLLQSLKFVAIGNYICVPALLPGAYALTEAETDHKVMDMMKMKTFDFSNGQLRMKKKGDIETKGEAGGGNQSRKINPSQVANTSAKTEPVDSFLLTADELFDRPEEESGDDDEYSTTSESNLSFQTPVKKIRVEENIIVEDVKKNLEQEFIEEEMKEAAVKQVNENNYQTTCIEELNTDQREENDKGEQAVELCTEINPKTTPAEEQIMAPNEVQEQIKKSPQDINQSTPQQQDEIHERYIIETESEGTLDDQDDLPWDGKSVDPSDQETCKKCEKCQCDKLTELEAIIKALQEELQNSRDELCESGDRLKNNEDELEKTRGELQKTRNELKISHANLQKTQKQWKVEQDKFKEMKKKMSREVLDSEFKHNYTLISSKIDLTQSQYAIVAKLQNLVHQTTRNYLSVDWTEWAVPLDQLEIMRSSLEEEHKKLKRLINTDKATEDRETSLTTHINALNVLPLPQRNIPDLIDIAFNMLKNHFQQPMVSYCRALLPPGLTQVPQIMPLWCQQPRYVPPSHQSSPYHHLINPMMASAPFQSGFSRPSYVRPGLQREPYLPYHGAPISITEVTPMPGSAIPREQTSATAKQNELIIGAKTSDTESSSSDQSDKPSGSSDKSPKISTYSLRELSDSTQVIVGSLTEEQSSDHQVEINVQEPPVNPQLQVSPAVSVIENVSAMTQEPVKTYIQIPPSVPMKPAASKVKVAKVVAEASAPAPVPKPKDSTASQVSNVPIQVVQRSKISDQQSEEFIAHLTALATNTRSEKSFVLPPKAPVPAPSVNIPTVVYTLAPSVSSATIVDSKKTIEATPKAPVLFSSLKAPTAASTSAAAVVLAASSPHPIAKETCKVKPAPVWKIAPASPVMKNVSGTPPAKKLLTALEATIKHTTKAPSQPVKTVVHQSVAKAQVSEKSVPPHQPPILHEPVMPINGVGEVKKPKMHSMDKLMHILRNKHPGILEYDLIWSIKIVRKNHNDSLTGLPLVQIIEEVDKFISSRQKLQLIPYLSSNKAAKSQGVCTTAFPGRSSNDPNYSTASASSLHREHMTKMNPWSKPQDVSWIKESPEADCVICWETLITDLKPPYTLKCQHTFHKQCLVNWFNQNRSCPTCRIHSTIDDEFPPLP